MRRVALLVLQREKENDGPRCRGRRQRARLGARSAELSFRPTRIAWGLKRILEKLGPRAGKRMEDPSISAVGIEPWTVDSPS